MQKKLLLLSFIEGAAVMAAELCGAKLLAPVFGSSLYVWASVMGVTLAALASGYFFGGSVAEKTGNQQKKLFQILSIAALFLLLMPVLSYYLIQRISYLPFLLAVLLSTITLLFFPIFLLGASSPLFISVQTNETESAGKVSGMVYAISTIGGICATFLCGFYLIPQIGLNACLISFGVILFLSNLLVFKFFNSAHLFLFFVFAYLNYQFSFKKNTYLYSTDSVLGHLVVQDYINFDKDSIRILQINTIIQTEMNLRTKKSVSDYVQLLDTLIPKTTKLKTALILGLGGGLTAGLLEKKKYQVDGVEFDKRIIDCANDFFFLSKTVNTVDADARYYLNNCSKKYDLVLFDVFKAEEQPSHVLTLESLKKLKTNLNDSALVLINWHGYVSGPNGLGTSILFNTLLKSGFNVQLCSRLQNENHRNVIFVASLSESKKMPFELNEKLSPCDLVNTDDLPLLEKYNAPANKIWRINYLRYYQGLQN